MNDWQLIQQWVGQRSESAFSQLVDRHIGFVHACARRQLNNSESAKEVTQSVFILLSEKAGSFREGIILPSWLFRTTRFLAARMLRSENRRKSHETKAASMNSASDYHSQTAMDDLWIRMEPHMDSALGSLPPGERDGDHPAILPAKSHARGWTDSSMRRYYLEVAGNNTFSVAGVPAGNYVLHCAAARGDVRRPVAIPSRVGSGEQESVDLGVIDLENN
jgi:RNA polymerase sigma factor (sigma-70 family)